MINTVNKYTVKQTLFGLVCFFSMALPMGSSFAEPAAPNPGGPSQAQIDAFNNAQTRMNNLQQQLSQIQQKVMQSNPDLVKQEQDFRALLLSTMKKEGQDPEKDFEYLKQLQAKARDTSTPEAERQKMMAELQQKNAVFQQMQQNIMRKKEIVDAQSSLNDNTFTAMKKLDPNTEQLIQDLQHTQREMMEIRQAAAKGHAK